MPSFKKNRCKGCRKRKTTLNLLDLPNEMLAEIFSYLKKKEIMKIIKVCKKLNSISKTPSLWKSTGVHLRSKKQVVSFCLFFKEVSKVQKLLFIRDLGYRANLEREVKYVRPLFKGLNNLRCLRTNFPLIEEMISCSLLHLSFKSSSSAIVIPQLRDLPNAPSLVLQFLHLFLLTDVPSIIEVQQIYNNLVGVLIEKCYSSLEFLIVDICAFNKDVMVSIGNCYNIKELRLRNFNKHSPILNLNLMKIFSKLPNLEKLDVKGFDPIDLQLPNLQINSFPKLKYLIIGTNIIVLRDYDAIRECTRNLNTFIVDLYDNTSDPTLFLRFITNYKTLKNIGISANFPSEVAEVLLNDIVKLQERRHFKSVCLCRLNFWDYSLKPILKQIKEKIKCSNCVNSVFDISVCLCCDRSKFEKG